MTYTIPAGTTLAEILALQYSDAPGIATRGNEITEWPAGLGSQPTQQQVTTWAADIATLRANASRNAVKSRMRDNHADRVLLRAVVKVLMNSLVEARTTINDLRAAMVNAASLADLKTRATAVTTLTNRTWQQALAAADQVIDAGQAEE